MKKTNSILILMIIILSISASALTINLKGPSDKTVSDSYKVEFIYGFDTIPEVKNCSLIMNGENKGTRSSLINYDNNKITAELEQGTYDWLIRCIDLKDKVIDSQLRQLTINVEVNNTNGYEIIYNNNGLRTYTVSITPGQAPVGLPVLKAGENILIKTAKTKYYIDILKMGVQNGVNFIEVRDRTNSKILKILTGESLEFDLDKDDVVDLSLFLEKVARNVDATVIVNPFPASFNEDGIINEQPEETITQAETTTEQTTQPEQTVTESNTKTPTPSENPNEVIPSEKTNKSSTGKVLLILAMVVILTVIGYFALKDKNSLKINTSKIGNVKKVEKQPKQDYFVSADKEQPIKQTENFEVIKSTSNKKKRN